MAHLSLSFLDTFVVTLGGQPVTAFESDKVRALLAYLAVEADRPHRRQMLAGLLWPERPEQRAHRSLSQALFSLRQAIGDHVARPPFLIITPQSLRFNPASDYESDVATFSSLLAACEGHGHGQLATCGACLDRLEQSATLYRGDFLSGFSLGDAFPFEEWVLLQRERLQRLAIEAMGWLANAYREWGNVQRALPYARRRAELAPWQEDVRRDLMHLLALGGEPQAALAEYEAFRVCLATELGMRPAAETRRLAGQIRAGKLGKDPGAQRKNFLPCPTAPLFPGPPVPSVARERELAKLEQFYQPRAAGLAFLESTIPLQLAHHIKDAGMTEKTVDYWRLAGERAEQLSAFKQAVAYLRQGLQSLEQLPEGPERDRQELSLQTGLATALKAVRGYGDPQVGYAYNRARTLCQRVGETDQRFQVLWSLGQFYSYRAEHQEAREITQQLLSLAERTGGTLLPMLACWALAQNQYGLGEFDAARKSAEQAIELYDPQQHHPLAFCYGHDPGVACLAWVSLALWMLGYPDQARRQIRQAISLAQELAHPLSLALAKLVAALVHSLCRDVGASQALAEAGFELAAEQGFPHWLSTGMVCRGWALAHQGQVETGLALMRQGIDDYQAAGSEAGRPQHLATLAEIYGLSGQPSAGLLLLTEALDTVDRTGESFYQAEIHRLRGELLLMQSAGTAEVEAHYRLAIQVARRQKARSWELRARLSLCRLWHALGSHRKAEEARKELADLYGWFTEGFDTADLCETRALLDALA